MSDSGSFTATPEGRVDSRTVLPVYLQAEYRRAEREVVESLFRSTDEWIRKGESRDALLDRIVAAGWSRDMATWVYSQVKAKGADLEILASSNDDAEHAATLQSAFEYRRSLMRRGWLLILVGYFLLVASLFLMGVWTVGGSLGILAVHIMHARGVFLIADSQGRHPAGWSLQAFFIGGVIPGLLLTLLYSGRD